MGGHGGEMTTKYNAGPWAGSWDSKISSVDYLVTFNMLYSIVNSIVPGSHLSWNNVVRSVRS